MHALLFSLFFSVGGVCVLAALDSTPIFFLPLALDAGVVIVTSRHRDLFWLFPILVSACSLAGATISYYIGKEVGDAELERFISPRRLDKIRNRVRSKGAFGMAALDLIPPPFPFTAFILAAGALEVNPKRFLFGVFVFRVLRFGAEAALAVVYGRRILLWLEAPLVRDVAYFFTIAVIAGSMITLVQFVRNSRRPTNRSGKKAA